MWFAVQERLEGLENNYTGRMSSFHVRMISAFWLKVFVCFITINKGFQVPVFKLHSFKYKGPILMTQSSEKAHIVLKLNFADLMQIAFILTAHIKRQGEIYKQKVNENEQSQRQ